jgi:hypothetical protein
VSKKGRADDGKFSVQSHDSSYNSIEEVQIITSNEVHEIQIAGQANEGTHGSSSILKSDDYFSFDHQKANGNRFTASQ